MRGFSLWERERERERERGREREGERERETVFYTSLNKKKLRLANTI